MLEFQSVSKSYDGKQFAVQDLDLCCERGEIFGLLGPNGAGKTTSLKMATGLLEPTQGKIRVNGFDIQAQNLEAKKQFAFVTDDPNVFLRFTGLEYLTFLANIYSVPKDVRQQKIQTLAREFGMDSVLGDKIQSYSHGMRQKVILIGALLRNPPVWILDEPMTGLDPKAAFILKKMMREHASAGNLVVFSTHVLDVAEKVCDRVGIIDHGQLLFVGTIPEMRERFHGDQSLEEMFLELTEEAEEAAAELSEQG